MTKPLLAYLKDHGVDIVYNCQVQNIEVDTSNGEKLAKKIILTRDGE
jgi:oleate hydratase